jgi:nitronate monooxygenase
MAGGFNTPQLAAAVANAGGMGSFGFAYSTPDYIDRALEQTASLTDGSLNANFFVFPELGAPSSGLLAEATEALGELPTPVRIEVPALTEPYTPNLDVQLEAVWRHRPAVLTFHFGLPPEHVVEQAHRQNIAVGVTATCLREATLIAAAGADFVVAQGWEAGGHRGIFTADAEDEALSLLALVRALSKDLSIPIVAAGGLMNGGDIAKVIAAGATAAQLGTAFLCCDEAGTPATHREVLTDATAETVFTSAFSGRPARGVRNTFIEAMAGKPVLPFPQQNTLTGSLRQWAASAKQPGFQSVWSGSGGDKIRPMSAAQLIATLKQELAQAAIRS